MGIAEEIKQKKFKSELNKLMINIMFTNSWLHEKQLQLFRPHGLTEPQYNVLRILRGQYPNPSTVNLIIDRMIDRMSNASRIVDKLEKKRMVERSQCKKDRRAVDVTITQKGLDTLAKLDLEMGKWESTIRAITDDETKLLNELLDKLRVGTNS